MFQELEDLLSDFQQQIDAVGGDLDDDLLLQKAHAAKFVLIQSAKDTDNKALEEKYTKWDGPSKSWIQKFKKRRCIAMRPRCGEAADADMQGVALARRVVPSILTKYDRKDIFNFDESALFFNARPKQSISAAAASGHKQDKLRVTVAGLCSLEGEKGPVVMINKSLRPRDFGNTFNANDYVVWHANKKGWMRSDVFKRVFTRYNNIFKSMERDVLVLMDNAASHAFEGAEETVMEGLKALKLSNLSMLFLPANTTSHVQPLDQGIIASFKARYRKLLMRWRLNYYEECLLAGDLIDPKARPSMIDVVTWVSYAWADIPAYIIENCWKKSGLLPVTWAAAAREDDERPARNFLKKEVDDLALLMAQCSAAEAADTVAAAVDAIKAAQPVASLTLQDVVAADEGEATEGELSIEEMVYSRFPQLAPKGADEEMDTDDAVIVAPVKTAGAAYNHASKLLGYLAQHRSTYSKQVVDDLAALLEMLALQQVKARQQTKIQQYFEIAPQPQTARNKAAAEGLIPARSATAAAELVDLASASEEEDAAEAGSLGDKDVAEGATGPAAPAVDSEPAAGAAEPADMEQ